MTRFEAILCVTMIAATVTVLGFAIVRPAPRPESQAAAPVAASPIRPSSGGLPVAPTGAPDLSAGSSGKAAGSTRSAPSTRVVPSQASRVTDPVPVVSVTAATVRRVTGLASWYCRPPTSRCTRGYPASGLYAAAGATLRVGNWRGRYVLLCSVLRCIRVRLVDSCACGSRVIDLYAAAFSRLAPLSRGVVRVTVAW